MTRGFSAPRRLTAVCVPVLLLLATLPPATKGVVDFSKLEPSMHVLSDADRQKILDYVNTLEQPEFPKLQRSGTDWTDKITSPRLTYKKPEPDIVGVNDDYKNLHSVDPLSNEQMEPEQVDLYNYIPLLSTEERGYFIGTIIEPCARHSVTCCNDTYGEPEYYPDVVLDGVSNADTPQDERQCPTQGLNCLVDKYGRLLPRKNTRFAEGFLGVDLACTGPGTPTFDCVAKHIKRSNFPTPPRCLDKNDTVDGMASCRNPYSYAPDGAMSPPAVADSDFCFEFAYTSSSLIVNCGGGFHCGTFVELHIPDDPRVIAESRLPSGFTSGYRMAVISTLFRGATDKVVCRRNGGYELWVVQRLMKVAPENFAEAKTTSSMLLAKKRFFVSTPLCDWDAKNKMYKEFRELHQDPAGSGKLVTKYTRRLEAEEPTDVATGSQMSDVPTTTAEQQQQQHQGDGEDEGFPAGALPHPGHPKAIFSMEVEPPRFELTEVPKVSPFAPGDEDLLLS